MESTDSVLYREYFIVTGSFQLFDLDQDGQISREEMLKIFDSIDMLMVWKLSFFTLVFRLRNLNAGQQETNGTERDSRERS